MPIVFVPLLVGRLQVQPDLILFARLLVNCHCLQTDNYKVSDVYLFFYIYNYILLFLMVYLLIDIYYRFNARSDTARETPRTRVFPEIRIRTNGTIIWQNQTYRKRIRSFFGQYTPSMFNNIIINFSVSYNYLLYICHHVTSEFIFLCFQANVVAQTRIQFNDRQLLQLIHQHFVSRGLTESASILQKEANLATAIAQSSLVNTPTPFRYTSPAVASRVRIYMCILVSQKLIIVC